MGVVCHIERPSHRRLPRSLLPSVASPATIRTVVNTPAATGDALYRVLIVDDDDSVRSVVHTIIQDLSFDIREARSADEALKIARTTGADFAFVDLDLPDMHGIDLVQRLGEIAPSLSICILSGTGDISAAVSAMRLGAVDFIQKPANADVIVARVSRQHEIWRLNLENSRLRETVDFSFGFDQLVGNSARMRRLKEQITRVAGSDASVLITGETGTGKELVARAIHHHSGRRDGPFVPVDCASLNESVVESELFGHVKGAFTGAYASRDGLIRSANGGTVFLDEIGEVPASVQVKLLRVLQERIVRPVGGSDTHAIDVRVISATNKNLDLEVYENRFREDLLYRLNVIHVEIPPLRDRAEDIPVLVAHFLRLFRNDSSAVRSISPEAVDELTAYAWPGNIRQLENAVRRIEALCPSEIAGVDDLPPRVRGAVPARRAEDRRHGHADRDDKQSEPKDGSVLDLRSAESRTILEALEITGGNRRKAAQLLGIGESTLYRKLKKHEPGA